MIIYISLLLLFVLWTVLNLIFLPSLKKEEGEDCGLVSILVPMRNEENNVKNLIKSLKELHYSNSEFLILNDGSTDRTEKKLSEEINGDHRFRVYNGKELPEGWVGKVHACSQLSRYAKGDYFLFLDADVTVHSRIIEKCLYRVKKHKSGLITGFPRFPIHPFLGRLLVPLQHFFVYFHLPIAISNLTRWPAFTAAHGAFLFFKRSSYEAMGGHEKVKSSLVEDIQLAREMKKAGFNVTLVNNTETVICTMYETNKDVWEGFLKNIYIGLGRTPLAVMLLTSFYFCFYFIPLPLAIAGLVTGDWLMLLPLLFVFIQTFIIDKASHQSVFHFVLMPLSALALIILVWTSMIRSIRKKGYSWKGRTYS